MRQSARFAISDSLQFKSQLLHWAAQFKTCAYLNSNEFEYSQNSKQQYSSYDLLVGVDELDAIELQPGNAFEQLNAFRGKKKDWLFGYFGYDLKNEIEKLSSKNEDQLEFPELHFFYPRFVFIIKNKELCIEYLQDYNTESEIALLHQEIENYIPPLKKSSGKSEAIQSKFTKRDYLNSVHKIMQHIQRGDIYELNFCVEFFMTNSELQAGYTYEELNAISQTPFSCYYQNKHNYLMCASPERFLKKEGTKLISQPIKGTQKRGSTEAEDETFKRQLINDTKERSENVMIVDLVRNDLSKTAQRGSVKVEELFGLYTFKQVHQLISTVSSELSTEVNEVAALKNAFPMGSMTGAPKVRAMQLIETFEKTKRGLYSGAVGYFSPDGNFDFNVVIRSLLYNAKNKYISLLVGSAITINSVPEKEYEECMLKADALFKVLHAETNPNHN